MLTIMISIIMSERLRRAYWVQNIIHNPSVLFTTNEKTLEGNARLVIKKKMPRSG